MLSDRLSKKHLSDSQIRRYKRREMRPDELISASDHLAACSECSQLIHAPNLVEAAYGAAHHSLATAGGDHLLFEQLAGFVDDTLEAPDREIVEHHLAACEECEADLQSLFDLSWQISRADQEPLAATAPRADASPAPRDLRVPWYRNLLSALTYNPLLQATCLLAISVLVIWGITRSRQERIDRLTEQIGQLQAENDSMRAAASDADAQIARLTKENEEVRLAGDTTQAALRLNDGLGPVGLDDSGTMQGLEAVPAELRTSVQTALTTARLQIPSGPSVKIGRVSGTLLGEAENRETFRLTTPVGSIVLSNSPAFRWESLPGATGYTVLVRDVTTGREIESEPLSDSQWTPKEPLERGHTYAWMVEAVKEGRRLRSPALDKPYAGFKVLDKQSFENIQRAQAAWGSSHLVMGIVYAKAGLKDAARKELKELQASNPDVRVINKLIKNIDSAR